MRLFSKLKLLSLISFSIMNVSIAASVTVAIVRSPVIEYSDCR